MSSRVGQRIRDREAWKRKHPIERICECGCEQKFLTKYKNARFFSRKHYERFRARFHIKYKRPKRFKIQENATQI